MQREKYCSFYLTIDAMKKLFLLFLISTCATLSFAQTSEKLDGQQLIGTWTLVSVNNIHPDGSRVHPYGENPKGMLMFDAKGNYTIQILKAVRPTVASGDKNKCTPEENAALVQGSNSHFGKYSVDEKGKIIAFKIEHASFPNWEGTEQKRSYTFTGNSLKYFVTQTTQGGQSVIAEVAWQKMEK
jgi:hypothetical protein